MNATPRRAPAIAEKLAAARALLAAHNGQLGETVLAAAEGIAGGTKKLSELRAQISSAEMGVHELEQAYALAARIDRQADVAAVTEMRAGQFAEFESRSEARQKAVAKLLKIAGDLAMANAEYSQLTIETLAAVPAGTVVPIMAIGAEGFAGPAFGPLTRLIQGEMYRVAPEREDGIGRFVLEFAMPSSELVRGKPGAMEPGIDAFTAANKAIVADIAEQVRQLDEKAMQAALGNQKEAA